MKKYIHIFNVSICGLFLILFSKSAIAQTIDSIPQTNQQQILIHSKAIKEDRTIWIHTPPEYATSTDTILFYIYLTVEAISNMFQKW